MATFREESLGKEEKVVSPLDAVVRQTPGTVGESDRVPADCFHPSLFINEELKARGWSRDKLAIEMCGQHGLNVLALNLYLDIGPEETGLRLGDAMAREIAKAFDVDADFFINLENAWLRWKEVEAYADQAKATGQ